MHGPGATISLCYRYAGGGGGGALLRRTVDISPPLHLTLTFVWCADCVRIRLHLCPASKRNVPPVKCPSNVHTETPVNSKLRDSVFLFPLGRSFSISFRVSSHVLWTGSSPSQCFSPRLLFLFSTVVLVSSPREIARPEDESRETGDVPERKTSSGGVRKRTPGIREECGEEWSNVSHGSDALQRGAVDLERHDFRRRAASSCCFLPRVHVAHYMRQEGFCCFCSKDMNFSRNSVEFDKRNVGLVSEAEGPG